MSTIKFDFSRLSDRILPLLCAHAEERNSAAGRVIHDACLTEVIRRGRVKMGVPWEPVEFFFLPMTLEQMADCLADLEDWAFMLEGVAALADDRAAAELTTAIELFHACELALAGLRDLMLAGAGQPPN